MRRPPVALLVLVVLAPACGHRGDPRPPLRRTPPPPSDFRLVQRGDTLEAEARAPAASLDGVPYEDVTVEFLWTDGPKDLEKAGQHRAVSATPGARVVATLPLPAAGATVRAAARAVAQGRKGQRTLTLSIVARTPPEPPSELAATLAPGGVALSWHGPRPQPAAPVETAPGTRGTPAGPAKPASPETAAPAPQAPPQPTSSPAAPPVPAAGPAEAPTPGTKDEPTATAPRGETKGAGETTTRPESRTGFFVYRRVGGAAYATPIGEEPLERRALTDTLVPVGAKACYVVRAVASTQPLVESAPSNEACVEMRDLAPPASPAGLAVLPRESGLEILWSPSAEPDLAGYRVYRAAPGAEAQRVAEVPAGRASWLDETVQRGVTYRYAVTAYDQAGNESERTEPAEAALP
jgi:hypothetical protein